jgi:transketolase
MPTGSLGHGLALANGFALADPARRCFVIVGDGELQEGSVWEAAMSTAALGLDNVTVIVDRNGLQITGRTEDTVPLEPLADRWRAFGWAVHEVDGHSRPELRHALTRRARGRPAVVIARTVKGKGLPSVQDRAESHYARLGERQFDRAMAVLRARARRRSS